MLLYLAGFFVVFALLFALPDLVGAYRELPPGGELTPEQMEHGEQVAREALRGRIPVAAAAAVVVTGLAAYKRLLPGLAED